MDQPVREDARPAVAESRCRSTVRFGSVPERQSGPSPRDEFYLEHCTGLIRQAFAAGLELHSALSILDGESARTVAARTRIHRAITALDTIIKDVQRNALVDG